MVDNIRTHSLKMIRSCYLMYCTLVRNGVQIFIQYCNHHFIIVQHLCSLKAALTCTFIVHDWVSTVYCIFIFVYINISLWRDTQNNTVNGHIFPTFHLHFLHPCHVFQNWYPDVIFKYTTGLGNVISISWKLKKTTVNVQQR